MKKIIYLFLLSLTVISCKKDVVSPDDDFEYTGALGDITRIISQQNLTKEQVNSLMPSEISSLVQAKYNIQAFVIEYKSLNKDNDTVIASGVIFIPESDSFAVPLISYQHGTVLKKTDAPSVSKGAEYLLNMAYTSSDGLVSCIPDYLGLGTGEGLHLYLNPREQANSVRDIIRAARKLVKARGITQLNGQIFLYGYSQGGHATMAAQRQLEKENPKEFKLTASAPMAGPYALSRTSQFDVALDSIYYPNPFYLPYLSVSLFNTFHIYDSYSDMFKAPYDSIIPEVIDGYTSAWEANSKFPYYVSTILKDSVREAIKNDPNHPIRLAAKEYDLVDDWTPTTPMKLYHCTGDDNVFYENAVYADSVFRQRGADVELVNMGTYGHEDCAPPAFFIARTWFVGFYNLVKVK